MMVKICGIRSLQDALAAVEAGAGMLGYNFYRPSVRYIEPQECYKIQQALAKRGIRIASAAVFVNETNKFMRSVLTACNLDYAQLSGDEEPAQAAALTAPWFKGIRPKSAALAAQQAASFDQAMQEAGSNPDGPQLLVDAYRPGEYGGTGLSADWSLASDLARKRRLLLAGGLKPETVSAAIQQVRPWGVDVATGDAVGERIKVEHLGAGRLEDTANASGVGGLLGIEGEAVVEGLVLA